VTNYVLLELGQPMHAFDAGVIEGGIRVRRAQSGDEITLLDGQKIRPDEDMLLICDHQKPVALAGIMGGQDSAVGDQTRDILLESAWFNPATIIGKGRRLGLATDSAHRYERGVDPELQVAAIERATALILEIAGGSAGPVIERSSAQHLPSTPSIRLRLDRVNHLLGTEFDAVRVQDILERLGMRIESIDSGFQVRPPSARRDLSIEVDLIEEVARLVGYDQLPSRSPGGRLRAIVPSERSVAMDKLRNTLHARGFQEIMTWSFVSDEDLSRLSLQDSAQPLANPLSQEMGVLRTSLLPGLLRTAAANLRHQHARLKLFETGHVFSAGDKWVESERLGLLIAGDAQPESWLGKRREFDFYDLKGEIEHLAGSAGHPPASLQAGTCSADWLHPGQSCALILAGRELGFAGQLHPGIAAELDLDAAVFVAELDLELLRQRGLPEFSGTVRYPSVRRDLALIAPETVPAAELQRVSAKAAGRTLERCIIFDIYQGEGIESGYKSIGIGLILRDLSRTLTDEDVDSVMLSVVESLKMECKVRLRGNLDGSDQG
ncbi:MAG: phenylalanine--tRNA ligase subunit beta, partial [Wenzhouxiangellaceae bacterium]